MGRRRAKRAERNFAFQAGQRRPEAVVDAAAKGEVAAVAATEIQLVGIREPRRVAVGRAKEEGNLLPTADRMSAIFKRFVGDAGRHLHWAVVTQQFLDGRLCRPWVRHQCLPLVWVPQQSQGAVADQVDGGFVSGDQEQGARAEQFRFGQLLPLRLQADKRGNQIVLRLGAALRQQAVEIVRQRCRCGRRTVVDRCLVRQVQRGQ